MIRSALFTAASIISVYSTNAQERNATGGAAAPLKESPVPAATVATDPEEDFGWKDRVAFIVAAGATWLTEDPYAAPAIDKHTGIVNLEKDPRFRANGSFGISYTPFVSTTIRSIPVQTATGIVYKNVLNYQPRGISFGLFVSPLSLSNGSGLGLGKSLDAGLGVGWRSGNFSGFLLAELYSLRQPRDYFVDRYGSNDSIYTVANETQFAIDVNDDSIFKDRHYFAWGFKIAYNFATVKDFVKVTSNNEEQRIRNEQESGEATEAAKKIKATEDRLNKKVLEAQKELASKVKQKAAEQLMKKIDETTIDDAALKEKADEVIKKALEEMVK